MVSVWNSLNVSLTHRLFSPLTTPRNKNIFQIIVSTRNLHRFRALPYKTLHISQTELEILWNPFKSFGFSWYFMVFSPCVPHFSISPWSPKQLTCKSPTKKRRSRAFSSKSCQSWVSVWWFHFPLNKIIHIAGVFERAKGFSQNWRMVLMFFW